MKGIFLAAISSTTFKQTLLTSSATIINGFLGALFYILVARVLGPEDFGLLAIAVAVLTLMTDIANLGTDSGLVRLVGRYLQDQKPTAYRVLKLIFKIRLISGLVVMALGWFLGPLIAVNLFQKEVLALPLQLAFLGVGGAQLFSFSLSAFQALQRFWLWSTMQISTNALRILIVLLLLLVNQLSLISSLAIYILLPPIGFLSSLLFLPRDFLKIKQENLVWGELFDFSKWIALTLVITAFSSRLDTFISGRLLSASQVGFYAAASQLVIIIPQIMRSLDTVFAPKMAQMTNLQDLKRYLKKSQLMVSFIAGLGLLASPLVIALIPLIYGSAYAQSVPVLFEVLLIANLIFMLSVPIHNTINYFFGRPQLFVYTSVLHLLIVAIVGWYLISQLGALGAALTVLIGMIFNLLIPAVWVMVKLKEA